MLLGIKRDATGITNMDQVRDATGKIGAEVQRRRPDNTKKTAESATNDAGTTSGTASGTTSGTASGTTSGTTSSTPDAAAGTYDSMIGNVDLRTLTDEELADMNQLVAITEYILARHEDKKDLHNILKSFAGTIHKSVESLGTIDDEIREMILATQSSLGRMNDIHTTMWEGVDAGSDTKM